MDYCLVEKWEEGYTLPEKSQAVALTPEAIFHLERSGIPYITLEDSYTSYEIRGNIDDFLLKQLAWLGDFDELLKEAFPGAASQGINLATIYCYGIKRLVDNVILTTRILRKFIERVKPEKIWFVGPKYSEGKITDSLNGGYPENHLFEAALDCDFKSGEDPYSLLIEPLCQDYGIDFERLIFNAPVKPKTKSSILKILKSKIELKRIKSLAKKLLLMPRLQSLYIYLKSIPAKKPKGRLLILRNLNSTKDFLIDTRKHGFEIFIKEKEGIRKLSWRFWQRCQTIDQFNSKAQLARKEIFTKILKGEVRDWINRYCGIDVSSILNLRFKYFFYKICPELVAKILDYVDFYKKNNIDFVVTPNLWTIDEFAAVAAARLTPRTKSIGFAHGADIYECKSRFFLVNRHYDFFFSPSSADVEHERWLVEYFNYNYPKVYEFPYFQRRLAKKSKSKRRTKLFSLAGKRRVVLYVPIIYGSRPGRSFQLNQPFPMEYFQWHMALIKFFSRRQDVFFIWKGLIQAEQSFNLMAEIIWAKGYNNIRFDSSRLTRWFSYAERVLVDVPSTAFFESVYSQMPVMALYRPKYQILRKNAQDSFGPSLGAYNSIHEGLKLVQKFLDSPREKYIVPFSEPRVFVPEILSAELPTSQKK